MDTADKERKALCEKACFMASAMGYLGSLDSVEGKVRMILRGPDGFTVAGEFMPTNEEAVESCSKKFLETNHDTRAGKSN